MADSGGAKLAVVGAAGLVIGALVTGGFNYLSHQGDLDAKMIELSIGLLRADPTPTTAPLREWAIDVLDKRAHFKFTDSQRAVLLKEKLQLPAFWSEVTGTNGGIPGYGPKARSLLRQQSDAPRN